MTKDKILKLLWEKADSYVSGAEIASRLGVSRAAVWKAMEQLRAEGYIIDSVTNKGYRLGSDSDVLSARGVEKYLRHDKIRPQVYKSVDSTNTLLKSLAADGAGEGLAIIASEQTGGRGRMGRSFYSPADSGIYMSLLLRPEISAARAAGITACAAVAVAEAIEELSGKKTEIKWVNDVLIGGKKVCGILTEASLDCESGLMNYAIVGIGINALTPPGGFPEELRDIASSVFTERRVPELRCRLAALVLDKLMDYYEKRDASAFFDGYKSRSAVLGKDVYILSPGREPVAAAAIDLAEDFSLIVRLESGEIKRVNSGEVSIRTKQVP